MVKQVLTSFPYRQNPDGQYFPVIPVRCFFKDNIIDSSALIDSGATISVFRTEVADDLGLNIESGKKIFLGGVGGRIKGYIHPISIEIASKKFRIPVVFSHEYFVSLNLLGRDTFFPKFSITFTEKNKILILD